MKTVKDRQSGFTLLEAVFVLGFAMTLMSFAIYQGVNTLSNYRANAAQDVVVTALRQARLVSITQRRDVQVWVEQTVTAPGQVPSINYQIVPLGNEPPQPPMKFLFPQGTQMVLEPGIPDTPMAFGNSAPVYIGDVSGGPKVMVFHPDGEFTDPNYNLLNGSIFIGVPNQPGSARAVTIMGGIGCIDHFTWVGTRWE